MKEELKVSNHSQNKQDKTRFRKKLSADLLPDRNSLPDKSDGSPKLEDLKE